MFKRFLSMFLSLLMIIGIFPVSVLAEENVRSGGALYSERVGMTGSNIKSFKIVFSGETATYVYKGEETLNSEIVEQLGAPESGTMGMITIFKIPEGYSSINDVAEYWENDNNSVGGWKEYAAEVEDVPEGYIPLFPVTYVEEGKVFESKRTFTIVWDDGNGNVLEETITVATEFGDVYMDDENGNEGGENVSFSEWWGNAPKVPMERMDLSYFDIFKENGQVDINYSNGVLDITIRNNNPDDWAEAYNAKGEPSFGGKQDELRYEIVISGVEGTEFVSSGGMGNANEHVMAFEKDYNKEFYEGNAIFTGWEFATIDIEESGSALVIPEDHETIDYSQRIFCLAWKDGNGNVTYEYIEVKVRVVPEDTVIDIPAGKLLVYEKISEKDRLTFDQSFASFKGYLDAGKSTVYYEYVGNETMLDEIKNEITESGKTVFTTVLEAKSGYSIVDFNTLNGWTSHVIAEDGKSIQINSWLAKNGNLYTNDTIIVVTSASDSDPNKLITEKITLKNIVNITWMENEGFEPMPVERFTFFANSLEKIRNSGVNVDLKDGELRISYNSQLDMKIYNMTNCEFQIVPPEDSTHHYWSQSGGPDPDRYYDLNYYYEDMLYDPLKLPLNESRFGINVLRNKTVGDITYYYSGPAGYYSFITEWHMSDGSVKREYFKLIFEEYINTVTTEGINEEDLENTEIESPTVVKDKFNHGYHGKDWRFTAKYYPQESADGKSYYFELEIKGEGSQNSNEDKRVYLPYDFISIDMDYEKAVEENLSVKIIHYLDSDHRDYEEIVGTPDKHGIYFDVKTFSPFVMEWEFGDEQEESLIPESTPVADQTLTVWYVYNSEDYTDEYIEVPIVNGKADITIPYFADDTVDSENQRFRLAFHMNNGAKADYTHYKGAFGNDILVWTDWENAYNNENYNQLSEEDFLTEYYWSEDKLISGKNGGSLIKYDILRLKNGQIKRNLGAGESYSERLYIQYFDGENKEAVAYEHIDLTITMEDIYPKETVQMPFGQVELNGYELDSEEIGYFIGVNGNTNELIVEMSEEQIWAKENTKDEYGNIYNVFEFSAPFEGNYKYVMAVGADEIANIKNLDAEDFENAYDPENKPAITFVLGWFEGGEFYQAIEGEKKTPVCFAWYDGTNITYQSFKLVQWMPEHEDEGEGEGPNLPNLSDWEGRFVTPDQVTFDVPESLRKAVTMSFENNWVVFTFNVDKLSEEDWLAAYKESKSRPWGSLNANADTDAPVEGIDMVYEESGNPEPRLANFIERSKTGIKFDYNPNQIYGAGTTLAEIVRNGDEVTIIPTVDSGIRYSFFAWYDYTEGADGSMPEPIYQIMPSYAVIKGDIKSYTFEDKITYVDKDRIVDDEKLIALGNKITKTYNPEKGRLIYRYNYSGEITKETPTFILNDIFGENYKGDYHFRITAKAPDGYKLKGEADDETIKFLYVNAQKDGEICGFSNDWEIEWEIIDRTKISDENPQFITENITVDFDPGITYMDVYWDPIANENRFEYYTVDEVATTKEALLNGGLTFDLESGILHTGFDTDKDFNTDLVPNAMVSIKVPNDGNNYVAFKVNESGAGSEPYYDSYFSESRNEYINKDKFFPINEWRTRCVGIAGLNNQIVNGIEIFFNVNDGGSHVLAVDWYTSTAEGAKPAKREYLFINTETYINEVTAEAVEEEDIIAKVEVPTPIGEGWRLTTNHYPQKGRNDDYAYYFELEASGNVPENEKAIYIPYRYLDETLTYEKAVEMKLNPKLHHYDDGHTRIELIKGELTPYGMKFVVSSFSPFVVELLEEGVNTGTNMYPDIAVFETPEELKDYIRTSYDPVKGILTVNVEKAPVEAWKAAYKNIDIDYTEIGGNIILTAPKGTVKEHRVMGSVDFEEFKELMKNPDSSLYTECDPKFPYSYSFGEIAHVNRTGGEVIITPEEERFDVAIAWQDADKNIIYQIIRVEINVEEGSIKFDDPFADIKSTDASRIDFMGGDSELFSPYKSENVLNYENGLLTFTYIGSKTAPDEIREDILSESQNGFAAMKITVSSPKEKYYFVKAKSQRRDWTSDVSEKITSANLYSEFKDFGELAIETEKYVIYWQNSEAPYDKIAETVSITYDIGFEIRWMDKYWNPVDYSETNTSRIDIIAEKNGENQEISGSEVENAGVNLEWNNGHFNVTYDKNVDIEIAREMIAEITPPANAVYYIEYGCGGINLGVNHIGDAEEPNDFLNVKKEKGEFVYCGNGNVPGINLSYFELGNIEDLGIDFWYTANSGYIQINVIDWYDNDYNLIKREYIYVTYGEYVNEEEAEATPEINEEVKVPTPVDDVEWKLTTNHFPQVSRFGEVKSYYFQLEGDENTPEGNKVIYLPYSFIDPEGKKDQDGDGDFDYYDALALKLKPKIHHYTDDHSEHVEGGPLKGELTEYGIRFVVKTFSPFVLDWSDGESVYIGETAYESLSEALAEAKAGDTITLFDNAEMKIVPVPEDVTLDLNGYTVTAEYVTVFGDIVDNSEENSGRLVVDEKKFMSNADNIQLPVKTKNGYAFVELKMFVAKDYTIGEKKYDVVFEPRFEEAAVELLKDNLLETGVSIVIRASWMKNGMPRTQDFVFAKDLTDVFFESYDKAKEKFGKVFTLKVNNAPEGISYATVVNSNIGVTMENRAEDVVN